MRRTKPNVCTLTTNSKPWLTLTTEFTFVDSAVETNRVASHGEIKRSSIRDWRRANKRCGVRENLFNMCEREHAVKRFVWVFFFTPLQCFRFWWPRKYAGFECARCSLSLSSSLMSCVVSRAFCQLTQCLVCESRLFNFKWSRLNAVVIILFFFFIIIFSSTTAANDVSNSCWIKFAQFWNCRHLKKLPSIGSFISTHFFLNSHWCSHTSTKNYAIDIFCCQFWISEKQSCLAKNFVFDR